MKNDVVYLTIEQGFNLISRIEELKNNPYFKDAITEEFIAEVKEQAIALTVNNLNTGTNLLQKFRKNGNKIGISKSKFQYVTRLTGIDVFDEKIMTEHRNKLAEIETNIKNSKLK